MGSVVIVGGTAGLGCELAKHYVERGHDVVIAGRDAVRAEKVANEIGQSVIGLCVDLAEPASIGARLANVGPVDHLVLSGIVRDTNSLAEYDIAAATQLAVMKLVGYTEVVHQLAGRLTGVGAVLLFGGMARVRPYPGSTTVSSVNAGVIGMVRSFSLELAPTRVNSIHPGIVGDSPFWGEKPTAVLEAFRSGTLTGKLATMSDIVHAAAFLLDNPAVNGVDLVVDGGWR